MIARGRQRRRGQYDFWVDTFRAGKSGFVVAAAVAVNHDFHGVSISDVNVAAAFVGRHGCLFLAARVCAVRLRV